MIPELQTTLPVLAIVATFAYLLGSIPFGLVIARVMGLGNLREIGSGNIGATNVLRTGNKLAAFLTVIFDAGKGAVAVLIALRLYGSDAAQLAGLFAFLGHIFPIWLRFQGGKGMATFLGLILALNFWAGFLTCMTWLAAALLFRISSLAALLATIFAPVWLWATGTSEVISLAVLLAGLVFIRHSANIKRLLASEEPKIGSSKTK